jgi:NAD-dependent dihydropyrimidine dehydrogenase PreA subunit
MIVIDEEKCNGCGLCVPNCPEGALQIIDGKVRLVSDLLCDGLGACVGECPVGALKVQKKEAEPYDEKKVMENIIKAGENTIKAHLKHLYEHGQIEYLNQAIEFLNHKKIKIPEYKEVKTMDFEGFSGCPGSRMMDFRGEDTNQAEQTKTNQKSELRQWPIQLHLISPLAPYFNRADLLLAADCTAFAFGNFHSDLLKGKAIAIGCPKLDENQEIYEEKITALIDEAKVNSITVVIMEVPCCGGLLSLAQSALQKAKRKVPIKMVIVGIKGEILQEEWV